MMTGVQLCNGATKQNPKIKKRLYALRVPRERLSYVLPWEDFGRMIFQKKSPLGSISFLDNVRQYRRNVAPERLMEDLA